MKNKIIKIAFVVFLGLIITSVIYGIIKNKKAVNALKNSDSVVAVITSKEPSRSHADIYVTYKYKGLIMHSEFSAEPDTFKVNDKVLLKISKQYPEKYIAVVRTIK